MKSTGRLAVVSLIYLGSAEILTQRETLKKEKKKKKTKKNKDRSGTESSEFVRKAGNIVCLGNTSTHVDLANLQEYSQVLSYLHP